MPKTKEESKALIEALEESGYEPESYSGRGMFGKECVSVEGVTQWEVARALPSEMNIQAPREDSIGLGNVIYWPSHEWPEDDDPEAH